jgi:hypothetical protein
MGPSRTWTTQDIGNVLQASCPNPVGPLLVFLDLLKRQAKCITELLNLRAHFAAWHPAAHMRVGQIRRLPFYLFDFEKLSAPIIRNSFEPLSKRRFRH